MSMKLAASTTLVAILSIAASCPGPASATVSAREQILSLDLGAGIPFIKNDPTNGSAAISGPGLLGGAQYIYHLNPYIGLGAGGNYTAFGDKGDAQARTYSSNMMTFEALGRWVFVPEDDPANLYAIVGAGVNYYSLKLTGQGRTYINERYASPTFSIGLGDESAITDSVVVALEARWRYIATHTFYSSAAGGSSAVSITGNSSEMTAALRLGYKFK